MSRPLKSRRASPSVEAIFVEDVRTRQRLHLVPVPVQSIVANDAFWHIICACTDRCHTSCRDRANFILPLLKRILIFFLEFFLHQFLFNFLSSFCISISFFDTRLSAPNFLRLVFLIWTHCLSLYLQIYLSR